MVVEVKGKSMKSLITTGHGSSGIEIIWSLMRAYEIAEAASANSEINDPAIFHQKLYLARNIGDSDIPGQVHPGQLWHSQAENLLINNVESEIWGWADARSSRLLDFWSDIDQSIHFVLLYVAPEVALAIESENDPESNINQIEVLSSWRQKNAELLDFYSRNRDRCLLINTYALIAQPEKLNELLEERFGIDRQKPEIERSFYFNHPTSVLRTFLTKSMLQDAEAIMLYEELESASDLPALKNQENIELSSALAEYTQLIKKEAAFDQMLLALKHKHQSLEEIEGKYAQIEEQLKNANTQWQASEQGHAELYSQIAELNSALGKMRNGNEEQSKENELLLLQLHQVQEELETYYLRVLESEKSYKQQAQTLAINKQELVEAYKQIQLIDNDRQFSKQENKRIVALNEKLETEIKVTRQRLDEAESQAKYVDANIQSISNKQSELQVQVTVLDMELSNARKSLDDKGKENELLLLQLHQVQEELESYFLKYQEIKSTKPEINNSSNSTLDKSNIKEEQKQHNKVHLLLSYLEKRRSARNIRRQISLIKQSGLFDERWYLNEYSDVAQSGIDPIKHYLKFGAEEGRDPSLAFDTRYYQECNPDISTSAINPLLHYISHGKAEGRRPHA